MNTIKLNVGCEVTVAADQDCPTIAILRPRSGYAQWLASESYVFDPPVRSSEYVDPFGNLCQRIVIPKGQMTIRVEAVVDAEPAIAVAPDAPCTPVDLLPDGALQFLLPSRYCPSDQMGVQASGIVAGFNPGYAQVEAIRAWINANIEYRYGVSDASTDARGTLEAGIGVCRDFSHIGISFCRALGIPARMVVGYLHQLDPMDLHAWFEAYVNGVWYTFDATQSAPRGGRVVLAYGRDAADVAFLSNYGPLQTTAMTVWVNEVQAGQAQPQPQPQPPVPAQA